MVVMDSGVDKDVMKLWKYISDLSNQITEMRNIAAALRTQSEILKHQAVNAGTGVVLRRFNTHLSNEEYEAELERMNAAMSIENQQLQHDNKQLGTLLKEFEQTLEQAMATFRTQAHEVQKQELGLMRQYESMLLQLESISLDDQLASNNAFSVFCARTSHMLRAVVRLLNGEEPEPPAPSPFEEGGSNGSGSSVLRVRPDISEEMDQSEWALERECELARLEKENEELRWLLKASEADADSLPRAIPRLTLPVRNTPPNVRRRTSRGRGISSFHAMDMQHGLPHDALQDLHDIGEEMGHLS